MAQEHAVAQAPSRGIGAAAKPDRRRWYALIVIMLGQLMVVLDATVVNVALPHAQAALDISNADRQWIVTAYTLTFGGLLLLGGRIADYFGRKRTFMVGLIGFAAASALGGAAVNEAMLFGARALQGAFGALLAPAALSLLTVTFTEAKDRAKAFGVFGAISGGGAAIGLISGGVLTQYASWRWCLFVNVPFALLALALAIPIVKESKAQGNTRYDIPGAILATLGLVALVYGFTEAAKPHGTSTNGWSAPMTISMLVAAALLLGGFLWWESRVKNPLLPLRVITDRNRGSSFLVSILIGAGLLGMFLFMTFYLQQTQHYSPLKTGVVYLPFSAGIIVSAGIAAQLLPRIGPRILMTVGGVLATASMIYLTQLKADSSYVGAILPAFIAMSLGMGLLFVPLGATALSGVSNHDAGVASAMVNTTQQVGGSLGTALLNTIFTTALAGFVASHGASPAAQASGAIHGYNVAFTASAILFAAAALLSLLFIRRPADMVPDDGERVEEREPALAGV
ncbi:MAG TPA: MFS transporter [Micromonosporaceae bacterium]|jgi:EmrB/QacA subfamily drug resistance transporter|nr:MFS transporter [Micromonosporaceae bacterium]